MAYLKNNLQKLFLICIIIFGFYLRVTDLPVGFFCDEASVGYNAYSLLTTGKDEWGKPFPIFLKALGEYKNPVMTYSAIPFVYLFGLSETSVRLASAFYGTATIFSLYFLAKKLLNRKVAFIAAFLLAISPWHIHLSRITLEGITPFVFFAVTGTYFWLRFIEFKNGYFKYGIFSVLSFAASLYSYFPARIFIPIYATFLLFLSFKSLKSNLKHLLPLVVLVSFLIFPLVSHMLSGEGLSRWESVKGELTFRALASKYMSFFSWDYLFFKGDIDYPGQFITRHSIRGLGQMYLFELPLFLIGIFQLIKLHKKKFLVIFSWLLIYPLSDTFTNTVSPYSTRSLIGVIPLELISAYGLYFLLRSLKQTRLKTISYILIFIIIIASFLDFQRKSASYPTISSDFWGWQYGPKPVLSYFIKNQSSYDQMCLQGVFNAPEIFLKFYDPNNSCQGKCQICDTSVRRSGSRQLFALSAEFYDKLKSSGESFVTKELIYYPGQKLAFALVEFN